MTFDITEIIVALIGLLAAIVTTVAIPWIRSKLGEQRWKQLQEIVSVAVKAAEQLYTGGDKKLEYATERVLETMAKLGLSFDETIVRAAIEAAVLQYT